MTDPSPLRTELRSLLTRARLDRDRPVAAALRSALGALENAEAVPASDRPTTASSEHVAGAVPVGLGEAERRTLTAAEEAAILDQEVASLHEAAAHHERAGRTDEAAAARRAAAELERVAGA